MPTPLLCPRFCTPTSDSLSLPAPLVKERCWQLEVPRGQGAQSRASVPTGSPFPLPPVQLFTPTRAPRTFRSFSFCPEQHGSPTYKPHHNPAWSPAGKELYVTGPALRGRCLDSAFLFFSCHHIFGPFLYFPMYSQWVHVTLGKNQHYFF